MLFYLMGAIGIDFFSAPRSSNRISAPQVSVTPRDNPPTQSSSAGGIDFNLERLAPASSNPLDRINPLNLLRPRPQPQAEFIPGTSYTLADLFEGNSDSLVAKAVGGAEGTRTPDGGYTSAYRGHTDPGNGVWNLGTFSYQHGAASPEEADRKQLRRLRRQVSAILHRADRVNISLGLMEVLNGIDLANQSPLAALGEPGYAEWLAEAYRQGLTGEEAILWARVMGYWDVRRDRWNAPGLGNTEPLIRRDQARRMAAIARAVDASSVTSSTTPTPSDSFAATQRLTPAESASDVSPELGARNDEQLPVSGPVSDPSPGASPSNPRSDSPRPDSTGKDDGVLSF